MVFDKKEDKEVEITEMLPTGFIAFEKLVEVMEDKLKDTETVEDFIKAMAALDTSGDGMIPNPIFKQMMMTTGKKMSIDEYDQLMELADKKGDGQVVIADFAE